MIESFLIALALCVDAFTIGLSYGIKEVKFPKISILIISFISVCVLTASMIMGDFLEKLLSNNFTTILSFLILVGLGLFYIIEGYIKCLIIKIKKSTNNSIQLSNIKIANLDIIINLSTSDTSVSSDRLDIITCKKAFGLGIALSLDSLGIGLGVAMGSINYIQIISFAFILSLLSIPLGIGLGRKIKSYNKSLKTFLISGTILIVLGISKLR